LRFGRRGRGGRDSQARGAGGRGDEWTRGRASTTFLTLCAKAPTQQRRQLPAALVAGHAFSPLSPSPSPRILLMPRALHAAGAVKAMAASEASWLGPLLLVAFFSSPFMQAHPLAHPHHHPSFPLDIAKLSGWTRQVPGLALPWPCNTLLNPSHRRSMRRAEDRSLLLVGPRRPED